MRSHSLEQSNKDPSGNCNPYASSPVVIPNVDNGDRVNGECPSPAPAVPPSGYVLAGQMNLGAINVPALNSANLSELDELSNVPLPNYVLPFSTHLRFVRCSRFFMNLKANPKTRRVITFGPRIRPQVCTICDAPPRDEIAFRPRARLQ